MNLDRHNPLIDNPDALRMRFMLLLSYNGAPFQGWQIQPNGPTVQQSIEEALRTLLKTPVHIVGAGRTDTGVNARYMTAHFDIPYLKEVGATANRVIELIGRDESRNKLVRSLNAILRPYIAVYHLVPVDADSHARFDATARTYRYYVHSAPDPFRSTSSLFLHQNVDLDLMNVAAEDLLGKKDFTSFSKLHTDTNNNICEVMSAQWEKYGPKHYYFEIKANRFLRNMVRAIVGTLLEIGTGKQEVAHIRKVISSMDRCSAGCSMPGYALYLWNIEYPYSLPLIPLPETV